MSLYNRIAGLNNEAKISPHLLTSILGEFERGQITANQGLVAFDPPLSVPEQTEATLIFNNISTAVYTRTEACDVFYLAELGVAPYDNEANFKTRLAY